MLADYLAKHGRVTSRGQTVSDTIDALGFYLVIFLAFGIVGSMESGRWLG